MKKARQQKYNAEYYRRNCERIKAHAATYRRKENGRRTGWTEEAFATAWEVQGGRCDICGLVLALPGPVLSKTAACRDHDHVTGLKRGILCNQCNRGLGMMGDDPDVLERAATYIRKHRSGNGGA